MQQLHNVPATTGSIMGHSHQRLQALRGSLTYQWRRVTGLFCRQRARLMSTCMLCT